jgi:hypothetical protein
MYPKLSQLNIQTSGLRGASNGAVTGRPRRQGRDNIAHRERELNNTPPPNYLLPWVLPLHEYYAPAPVEDHFYTTDINEFGVYNQYKGIIGYLSTDIRAGFALYSYWNSHIGDHLYTIDFSELGNGAGGYS